MECIVGEDSIELSLGGEFNLIAFFDKKILFFLSSQLELIMCYERIFFPPLIQQAGAQATIQKSNQSQTGAFFKRSVFHRL